MSNPDGWIVVLAGPPPQRAQLIAPPRKEPTIPSNIVAIRPIASLPGISKRANNPATSPIIRNQMMLIISVFSFF